ncbi:hypothetical protein BV509_07380 [Rhodovulum sulfidophilum]|uniref:DUF1178 family protein n=1 Tax=Rhodovulum visakhapatnamense TaxID=364297 RepID=A0ABS1RFU3_9RHOB|nr:DUF1178 family protein [Rhodovulum visakhapatnamense]MBL3571437.1 DUF1178 family protein [Rhodovulum visakhapatnamense]MBL3578516.1 DUF1178 family protein [Rhodovulum visakhapatnamense]OLS44171.1 hypothetical protein BV509_07380 [Rhodovulum sulfidophilum]
MIRYALTCADGHRFESWFQSAAAFDTLLSGGHVTCAVCGNGAVSKALMAPNVATDRPGADPAPPERTQSAPTLSAPAHPAEQALADLRKRIEEKSDYVGLRFVQEARDMHAGLSPARPIHGEARADEALRLIEDGIPVAPLPFLPSRKTN